MFFYKQQERNERMNPDYLLSSVKNALRVLRTFSMDKPERKVTEIAAELGLGKSTVSRLLATLASEGFVIKDPDTQEYRLGLTILGLNTVATSCLEINRASQPILERLVQMVGETAHVATLEGMDVVYLSKVECKHPVQILTHIGRRNPLHCTSSGKVMLAYQKEDVIQHYIEERGLKKYTVTTITDPADFRQVLKTIKEQEYSTSIEELREGVSSVSAPIRDYSGKVVYAINVIGPSHRMNPHDVSIINKLKSAAHDISEQLGYRKIHFSGA
jgi:IclR family transcriptional regulator, KDG regulon repressor